MHLNYLNLPPNPFNSAENDPFKTFNSILIFFIVWFLLQVNSSPGFVSQMFFLDDFLKINCCLYSQNENGHLIQVLKQLTPLIKEL